MVMHVTSRTRTSFVCLLGATLALVVAACSGSDETPSKSNDTSNANPSPTGTGTPSPGDGACTGDIVACTIGSLSDAQQRDFCSTLYAAIDDPPGTKYTCKSLERDITLNDKATCVAQRAPKGCSIKVGQVLDCYKAAKKDACGALADDGVCRIFFSPPAGCGGS